MKLRLAYYPTIQEVNEADELQLRVWFGSLPEPVGDIHGSILDRIAERLQWTHDEHGCRYLNMTNDQSPNPMSVVP